MDVAIIGSGIASLSLATNPAERGRVTLADPR